MREQHMSITEVKKGIICQQVNCHGAYGRGVSGAIGRKWPIVPEKYREFCKGKTPKVLFGKIQVIQLANNIYCMNLFTQLDYGDSAKTGIVYTDMDSLTANLRRISETTVLPVYIPYRIGCGLAGGDWSELYDRLKDTNIIICRYN